MSSTAVAPTATNAVDTFFANLKTDLQVVEADVVAACQNIGAGIEIAAEDLQWFLSWLGGDLGNIANLVTTVQNSVNGLSAAGVPIPTALTNGITAINQAVAGVNAALNNQTIAANQSTALVNGYQAAKTLQVAAAGAAAIASAISAATAPASPATPATPAS